MTYPPGSSGYPPAQQPPGSYGSSSPSFAKPEDAGPSKLPLYLSIGVVVLGLAAYLSSFGPLYDIDSPLGSLSVGGGTVSVAALVAALLAAVGVLPKAKNYTPIVAVIAVVGALVAISDLFQKPDEASIGWGLWLVLTFAVLQAIAAVGALLLEAGVVTAPAPKPKFDQYAQYGLPPGGYYGQQGGYPSYGGGYPSGPSTGGFAAPSGPSTGGFSAQPVQPGQQAQPGQPGQQAQPGQHQGPPTPPTGFPSFGQPPASGQIPGSDSGPTQQFGTQGQQAPSSSAPQSGPQQL